VNKLFVGNCREVRPCSCNFGGRCAVLQALPARAGHTLITNHFVYCRSSRTLRKLFPCLQETAGDLSSSSCVRIFVQQSEGGVYTESLRKLGLPKEEGVFTIGIAEEDRLRRWRAHRHCTNGRAVSPIACLVALASKAEWAGGRRRLEEERLTTCVDPHGGSTASRRFAAGARQVRNRTVPHPARLARHTHTHTPSCLHSCSGNTVRLACLWADARVPMSRAELHKPKIGLVRF